MPELLQLDGDYEQNHTFTDYANWLIPGHLLLGRYPFCEPSRCKTRDHGEIQLKQLLDAGVTTFVCLQDELPPQDKMRIGGVNGFLPYRATVQLLAASMSGPPPMQSLHELRTPDLDKFLPPRRKGRKDEAAVEAAAAAQGGVAAPYGQRLETEFMHCPIVDLGLPTEQQTLELCQQLEACLRAGKVVYLHCWGGRGRAGTIGACLLGKAYGLQAAEALERVQRAFDTRLDEGRPSPETAEQSQFVKDFIAKLQ